MKRTDFTKSELKQLRKNLALYETYRRRGELMEETNCGKIVKHLIKPHSLGSNRNSCDPWFLIALDSKDCAYGCYDDDMEARRFEWAPLKNLRPYIHEYEYDLYFEDCLERELASGSPATAGVDLKKVKSRQKHMKKINEKMFGAWR